MSDTSKGPGWWQAVDGKWYPPAATTQWVGEEPPPPALPTYRAPGEPDPEEERQRKREGATHLPSFSAIVPEETRTPPAIVHMGLSTLPIEEDRIIEFLDAGTPDGTAVLFHPGTPFAAAPWEAASAAAARCGLRLISWSRAGFGTSTRVVGRTVADLRVETETILRGFAFDRFLSLGWSGGGSYALADAAQIVGSCVGAAVVSTAAPYDAEGLEWLAGVGRDRVDEVIMAKQGGTILERFLEDRFGKLELGTPTSVAVALGGPLSPEDTEVLEGDGGQYFIDALRAAVGVGVGGWYDDDFAMMSDWHVDLSTIRVPVTVWQGWDDRLVPPTHGTWLTERIPGSKLWPLEGDGHVSALARHLDTIFADLAALAAQAG